MPLHSLYVLFLLLREALLRLLVGDAPCMRHRHHVAPHEADWRHEPAEQPREEVQRLGLLEPPARDERRDLGAHELRRAVGLARVVNDYVRVRELGRERKLCGETRARVLLGEAFALPVALEHPVQLLLVRAA